MRIVPTVKLAGRREGSGARRWTSALLGWTLSFVAVSLHAASPVRAGDVAPTFCEGAYALCIEASCSPIVSRGQDGHLAVERALCACDVVEGWSMGPMSCPERSKTAQGARTFLASAFSNLYSGRSRVLSCPSPSHEWAYCYGAPCVVDPRDPKKAMCDCPVKTGPAKHLGGDCKPTACEELWVGATPAGDEFAGPYFHGFLRKEHPEVPVHPAAQACPGGSSP
jgi:hypothetical protein